MSPEANSRSAYCTKFGTSATQTIFKAVLTTLLKSSVQSADVDTCHLLAFKEEWKIGMADVLERKDHIHQADLW